MVVLLKILQVILALSILIIFHEAGHFLWARIFRIRVDKFFLFFDAGGVKLFSTRMPWFVRRFPAAARWKTEYGIGWLPLGGYCKIAGMVDESLDTEQLKSEPQPWEFRSKPAWQRLLVMGGGVLNNFLLAILLFIGILAIWGDNYLPNDRPVYVNELGREMGFENGDYILRFDDYIPEDFLQLQADLARRQVRKVTVLRGTDTLDIFIDAALLGQVVNTPGVFDLAIPFVVDSVMTTSPNTGAGLRRGDRIAMIDTVCTPYLQDAQQILRAHPGETLPATVLRGADTLRLQLSVSEQGMLGIYFQAPRYSHRDYTFLSAIPGGLALAWDSVSGYVRDLRLVATPSTGAYKSVGSFIAIGQVFPSAWDWHQFLYILAMLSIMLGVMNLLPIPALDGGHIVFCLYEMVTGRKPSDRFLMVAQLIGMFLLLLLMFLAFGNDIARLIR
ncbi:MAG: RIP metalloprotease RseP [Bacteroidales bacterium]|nr:RIP metalloprotease RseP [Bacteroidales bacterium]